MRSPNNPARALRFSPRSMTAAKAPPTHADSLVTLYGRADFKLRRAHQVALSVFAEACRAFNVTSSQYGILVALRARPGLDQIGLAQALGLDRSTTGTVVALLEKRGLLRRDRHPGDGRRRVLTITPRGSRLLHSVDPAAKRARRQLLAPLTAREAAALGTLLDRLLAHHDVLVRVPLRRPDE